MKKFIAFIAIFYFSYPVASQSKGTISGKVLNAEAMEPLTGANVLVENVRTVLTDKEGKFTVAGLEAGNYRLHISYVSLQTVSVSVSISANQTSVLDILLSPSTIMGNDVVVSASKKNEKITRAPASIFVIGNADLNQFAGSNVGELVSLVQGVEYTRTGVDQITFNARGFHSAFNNKVMQLIDGRNSMAPLSGSLPLFNNASVNKEDIERIEIVLGPQSALYGPNAHNALFNYITKDPRKYGGTTIASTIGNLSQYSTRLRHASTFNENWAYKFSGEYSRGKEFTFYDSVYAGGGVYGPPVAIPERNVDFDYRHIRGEGAIYYNINAITSIVVSAGASTNDFLQVTTAARNQMLDVTNSFIQARLIHPRLYVTAYNTRGNLGSSFIIGSYTRDFWDRTHSTLPRTDSIRGKLTETEAEGFAMRLGNRFKEKGSRFNAEIQYNKYFENPKILVIAGASMQRDDPNGYGINLVDVIKKIQVNQYGSVLQIEKQLPFSFRLSGASRWDNHSVFGNFISPKIALVKDMNNGSFRVCYGKAYAMPSILSQFAKIGNFLFGNGEGITYIPNGTKMDNEFAFRKTTTALKAEEVRTWELGYKAALEKLFIDISAYTSISKYFLSPLQTVPGRALMVGKIPVAHNPAFAGTIANDTLKNAFFSTFFNYGNVKAYGVDAGLGYQLNSIFSILIKYSWFNSDITNGMAQNDANKDGFVSDEEKSLNAPRHRGNISLHTSNLLKRKASVILTARLVEQYNFFSGNQIGTEEGKGTRGIVHRGHQLSPIYKNYNWGALGGFTSFNINANYKFNENVAVNAGITNLFNTKQIEFVGSPSIGRLISIELKIHLPD
jgi:outer membrane receptor for ferrienterochelin and colicins